jgi:CBS domain-containing protein
MLHNMSAADVMIANPAFLPSELGLNDALAIMTEYGYHAMPVLEDHGRLVGLAEMRVLVEATQELNQTLVESKDNLLSTLMHHENYALCGPVSTTP